MMIDGLKTKHRQAIIGTLNAYERVERAVLFGSRAHGTFSVTSDIDIALFGDDLNLRDLSKLMEALDRLVIPQRVDLLLHNSINNEDLLREIKVHGIDLYRRPNNKGEWKLVTLGEICSLRSGSVFKLIYQGQDTGDYPFIKVSDMELSRNKIRINDANNWISQGVANDIRAKPLPTGSIVFAKIGEALKRNRLRIITQPTIVDNNMMGAIPKADIIDPLFLFFAMHQFDFGEIASGTALPYLTISSLTDLTLELPSIPEQKTIAYVLGTLDDKMELNRRMNQTLEEMAQALFKSWFVDFDPVRAKIDGRWQPGQSLPGLPAELYDLFPDRLAPSDLGEIPEDWQVCNVGDLANIRGGKQLKRTEFDKRGSFPVYGGAGRMGFANRYNADGYVITVGRVGAYCGNYVAYRGKAWVNNNASQVIPLGCMPNEWLFLALQELDMESIKKGAAQPFVSNGDIAKMKIVYPADSEVPSLFQELVKPIILCSESNDLETAILSQLRDTLLPKLLSGELRVETDWEHDDPQPDQ